MTDDMRPQSRTPRLARGPARLHMTRSGDERGPVVHVLRALGLVTAVLIAAYVLYLVAANVIIRTHLLRSWINGRPEDTYIDYASAITFWPGQVHVRDLLIRDRCYS